MAELKGIYPILATPFQSSGELDENSFERLIEFLVVSGVHGLTLFGLAGEYYKLSDDERRALRGIFLARTQGRLARIVSVTEHYVKVDSTPAGAMISSLIKESRGRIKPFIGYAGLQMVDAFARGAIGCMPGCSLAESYLEVYAALVRGDRKQAAALHSRLLPLINYMMQSLEFIIQCEKTILCWRGIIDSDYCRRPGMRLTEDDLRS